MSFQQITPMRRWAATNIDATSFASKIPTLTKPVASATAAVLDLGTELGSPICPIWMKMEFLLLGAENDVASFRLIGWNRVISAGVADLWVPQPFLEVSCIASQCVGIAASAVLNTERWADTIAPVALMAEDRKIAAGTSVNADLYVFTPANDTAGHIRLPILGAFEMLEFTLDQTTNTPTGNILYSWLRKVESM